MKLFQPAEAVCVPMTPPSYVEPSWKRRFEASVFAFSKDRRACRFWTGPFDECGYGMFSWNRTSSSGGRTAAVRAHRFIFERFNQYEVPPGLVVCHACDTPQCVNPLHLYVGTIEDNIADRNRKGRQARGERNARAKLTAEDIIAIRASDRHPDEIAAHYGVTPPTIHNIRSRRIWRHI